MRSVTEREPDILWGAKSIGEAIGRSERQAFHMLTNGEIPGKMVGGRWCSSRRKLDAFFQEDAR